MKKRGFTEGKWNGVGGKVDYKDKNIKSAAIRETFEEIRVKLTKLTKMAVLNFFHQENPDFGQQVHVYLSQNWLGTPHETEEMAPKWFSFQEIPYSQMWEDDNYWLPQVLKGKYVNADFLFNPNQKLLEKTIKIKNAVKLTG